VDPIGGACPRSHPKIKRTEIKAPLYVMNARSHNISNLNAQTWIKQRIR